MYFIPLINKLWAPAVQNTPKISKRNRFLEFSSGRTKKIEGKRRRLAEKSWKKVMTKLEYFWERFLFRITRIAKVNAESTPQRTP